MENKWGVIVLILFALAGCRGSEKPAVALTAGPSATISPSSSPVASTPAASSTISLTSTEKPEAFAASPTIIPTFPSIDSENAGELNLVYSFPFQPQTVNDIAWSPTGRFFAIASKSNLTVLDETFRIIFSQQYVNFDGFAAEVVAVDFLSDHELLVIGKGEIAIRLLDLSADPVFEQLPITAPLIYDEFILSPDKRLLAISSVFLRSTGPGEFTPDSFIRVWDMEELKLLKSIDFLDDSVLSITFSEDGAHFSILLLEQGLSLLETDGFSTIWTRKIYEHEWTAAIFSESGNVLVAGSDAIAGVSLDGTEVRTVIRPEHETRSIGISVDGELAAVGSINGEIELYDAGFNLVFADGGGHGFVWEIALSPDGKVIAAADSNSIRFFAVGPSIPPPPPTPLATLPPSTLTPTPAPSPTPRPTGTSIPLNSGLAGVDLPPITALNAADLDLVAHFTVGFDIELIAWSGDMTRLLLTTPQSVDLYTFSPPTGSLQNDLIVSAWGANGFAISPDGTMIAKLNASSQVEILDTGTGELLQTVGDPVTRCCAWLAWGPRQDELAVMFLLPLGMHGLPDIRIYDLVSGLEIETYAVEGVLATYGLTYSPAGSMLATTSGLDGYTYVWNRNVDQIAFAAWGSRPTFSLSGQFLATRVEDTAYIWSTTDGSRVTILPVPAEDPLRAPSAINLDGSLVVTTGDQLTFWSLPDGTLIDSLDADDNYYLLVFSPDGKYLAAVRGDGDTSDVLIWAVVP